MTKICSSVITAMFLIFTVFCADSQARVCFATDPDCGAGGNFGNMDDLQQYDDACKESGYIYEKNCPTADQIKYNCPYKSSWLKCCNKEFHYEGCIYPLEAAGQCGTRYSCRCPDEYGVSSDYAETNNCQPGGGYCMLNDGTTDTIKYKTCTCDPDIYTDPDSCKNNQTESSSCRDDAGNTRKKCYCDRSAGHFPYAECMYGPSVGAATCVDSSSGREYYSRCKTAEEACRTYDNKEDGDSLGTSIAANKHTGFQHSTCSYVHNCRTENKIYNPATKTTDYLTSYNCVLGEQCPYPTNPSLYKCVFDKASWCTAEGYDQNSSVKLTAGTTCTTKDGIQGKVVNCPANDSSALYYYRCKISCDQRVLKEVSTGGLSTESLGKTGHGIGGRFGEKNDLNGVARPNAYWYYLASPKNGFRKGYHLFLRGDARLPEAGLSYNATNTTGDDKLRADGNSNNPIYASINGISALYKLDPVTYADCADDYEDMTTNPTLTVPLNKKYANDYTFSRDFHNINIRLSRYKDDNKTFADWGNNTFEVHRQGALGSSGNPGPSFATTYVWSNIKISVDEASKTSSYTNSNFDDQVSSGMIFNNDRAIIDLHQAVKLRFTGNVKFDLPILTFATVKIVNPEYDPTGTDKLEIAAAGVALAFRTQEYAIIEFKDATVSGSRYSLTGTGISAGYLFENSGYPDFDSDCTTSGSSWDLDGVLNIDNSTVSATNHYGCLYLNMQNNSTYNVLRFYSRPLADNYGKSVSGLTVINRGKRYCRGATIREGSTFNIKSSHGVTDIRRYLYIDGTSKVVSNNPIRLMNSPKSVVCIAGDGSLTVNVKTGTASYGKGTHTYSGSYNKDYAKLAEGFKVGTITSNNANLIMYSAEKGACIPYELNNDPSSSATKEEDKTKEKNAHNPWRDLCTGKTYSTGWGNPTSNKDNMMPDEVSMRTPGRFDVKIGTTSIKAIYSWYPRENSTTSTYRCDMDRSGGYAEIAKLKMCSTGTYSTVDSPEYTDGGFDTYIPGYNNNKCLNRRFLCSGCAYCSQGVGYSDWSDEDGGLGTTTVSW